MSKANIITTMNIAIDSSPLKSGHRVRGIGSYTQNLISSLKNFDSEANITLFNKSTPPPADIVHYPYFDLFFHTLPIRKFSKRIVTVHDVIPLIFPEHFPKGIRGQVNLFLQKVAIKNTDFIISDSESTKKDIIELLHYPENRIQTIYLAPDDSFKKITPFAQQKAAQKFELPKTFCLYVGDVNWNKNIEVLMESIKISKTPLVMVGSALTDSNIPETRNLDENIAKLGINNLIIKTGYVDKDKLVSLYNLASVTILPSIYEGFGLPVLESMACGTPVICSKTSSLIEIGSDVAFYCNPGSAVDIAGKISESCSLNTVRRNVLTAKLQNHAKKFTWQKVASETIEVYRKVNKY